ncbi:MAG: 16S rRNA (cytosine(1402)-N(4))-methyltransferase RsmH [Pseudomonadota bacterium]
MSHRPVMLSEVIEALQPTTGETYVDGTFGGGGYALRVLAAADCQVIAIDRDEAAIARAKALRAEAARLSPILGRFGDMDALVKAAGIPEVDGVMLDIGVSSFQIDEGARGFSFQRDGPLDMRMGQTGPSAKEAVNALAATDLTAIIRQLGEERQAKRIANTIVSARADTPFETTLQLANCVEQAVGGRRGQRTHPATRTFQAIRMFVNDELGELARGLVAAERLLRQGGRLVVVTFHSLEDRLVKQFMRRRAGLESGGSRYLPEVETGPAPSFHLRQRKAIEPSAMETADNPRARSARLRVAVRTNAPAWPAPADPGLNLPSLSTLEEAG